MQHKRNRVQVSRRAATRAARFPALAFAALAATSAYADDPNPYFIGLREVLGHDSNVFRSNTPVSASYSTTSLLGGFDQQVSRQRFYANANVGVTRYSGSVDASGNNTDNLNNTSYGLAAGWDWQTIEKLSGTLSANVTRSLASLGDNSTSTANIGNLVTTQQYGLTARYGGDSTLSIEGDLAYHKVSYSQQSASDSTGNSASIGLYYRPGATLRVGTAARFSQSDTPQGAALADGTLTANKEKSRNLDLIANWQPSSTTTIYSRLSWTHQTNSQTNSRDFNGATGSVTGVWAVTSKVSLNAALSRDSGINGTFFTMNPALPSTPTSGTPTATPVRGLSESSQITNSFSLGANYAASSKITVTANAQLRYAKLVDNVPAAGGTSLTTVNRDDNSKYYALGVSYEVARNWMLGCNYSHSTRELDASVVAAGLSYSANVASCSAQFTLR